MDCPICSSPSPVVLEHQVRHSRMATLALCPTCDLLFVVNPTWLDEAYSQPINTTDIGYITRNIYLSRKSLILFFLLFGRKGLYVDYAAGYGVLVRLMRDYGLNFFWLDRYTDNLFSKGFEFSNSGQEVTAITCFECFEHLTGPTKELEEMLSMSSTIFFSTRLRPHGSVPNESWEYYGWNHGQHVSFYSIKTLQYLAHKYSLHIYSDSENVHLFSKKKLPKNILNITNLLTKLHFDIFLRRFFKSKLPEDHSYLMSKEA